MSWDVYAVRAPAHLRRLEDLPDGSPPLVGQANDLVAAIREAAPHVDSTDPTWLLLEGSDHSVEVSLGKFDKVHSITFYINGGDGAVGVVLDLCRRLGVTPYDTETGDKLKADSKPPSGPPPDDDPPEKRHWWQRAANR
jgi:hypothetical protein